MRGVPVSPARRAAATPCVFRSCYRPPALKPLIACAELAFLGERGCFSSLLLMQQLSPVTSGKGAGRRGLPGCGREKGKLPARARAVGNPHPGAAARSPRLGAPAPSFAWEVATLGDPCAAHPPARGWGSWPLHGSSFQRRNTRAAAGRE